MGGLTTLAAWKRLNGHHGDIAQLGEHLLCTQGVTGSSPVVSTILQKILRTQKVTGEEAKPTRMVGRGDSTFPRSR